MSQAMGSMEKKEPEIRIVHKIGGKNMSRLDQVGALLDHLISKNEKPILVVSAFENVTTALIKAIDDLYESHGVQYEEADIQAAFAPCEQMISAVIDKHFKSEEEKTLAKGHVKAQFSALVPKLLAQKGQSNSFFPDEDTFQIWDDVIAVGEVTAALVLERFLAEKKIAAHAILDVACAPLNDGQERNKQAIHRALSAGIANRIKQIPSDDEDTVLILGGHIAGTPRGMRFDIGRNYSDTTAVDVAAALSTNVRRRVEEVVVWKDVDGLSSANPKDLEDEKQDTVRVISHVSYDEGIELSGSGMQLLQVEALILAQQDNIRVRVKNILRPERRGTSFDSKTIYTAAPFKAIATQECDTISFRCAHMVSQSGFLYAFGLVFKELGLSISDPISSGAKISYAIPLPSDQSAREHVRQKIETACQRLMKTTIDGEDYVLETSWSQGTYGNLSIVGAELTNQQGILSEITGVLAAYNINVFGVTQEESQIKISFYVLNNVKKLATQVLHAYFIEKDPAVHQHVAKRRGEISERYR